MSFKHIHDEGALARGAGKSLRDNPYCQCENLPVSQSAAAYRAWQMRVEAWEFGWAEQEKLFNPPSRTASRECVPRSPSIVLQPRSTLRNAVARKSNAHRALLQPVSPPSPACDGAATPGPHLIHESRAAGAGQHRAR